MEPGLLIYVFTSSKGAFLYLKDFWPGSFNYENRTCKLCLWRGWGGPGGRGPQSWGLGSPEKQEKFACELFVFCASAPAHSRSPWLSDASVTSETLMSPWRSSVVFPKFSLPVTSGVELCV